MGADQRHARKWGEDVRYERCTRIDCPSDSARGSKNGKKGNELTHPLQVLG